jgi:PAS domain S-box-containing protein
MAEKTPIIVLTERADEKLAMAALAKGAQDYLIKSSVDEESIFRSIRYAISRSKSERNNLLLVAALKNVPYGVLITNAHSHIEWCNPAFEKITGFTTADVTGQTLSKLLKLKPLLAGEAAQGVNMWKTHQFDAGWSGEVTGLHQNQDLLELDLTISPLKNRLGFIEHFIVTLQNIGERKRIERMKKEFVSTVSHELRTPLTSITGALSLVAHDMLGALPDKIRSVLDIAYKNSKRLTMLIDDLLDMEKLLAGKMQFDLIHHNLLLLVQQTAKENKSYADKYNVEYVIKNHVNDVVVNVDAFRFQQVLNNFLSNAAKFSPPDQKIYINIENVSDYVRVSVHDFGEGVPEKFKARIFEKFSQADSSDSRKKGGTGLGLAISKELVERMGGRIGFNSEPGQGTCFFAEFKRVDNF